MTVPQSDEPQELERIRAVYASRVETAQPDYYSRRRAVNLFFQQSRHRHLRALLEREGLMDRLPSMRVLETGCGGGLVLHDFEAWEVPRAQLAGIDLRGEAVSAARALLPGADLRAGSASALPWEDASFDLVIQFTMFTSILDSAMRAQCAAEMRRVLRHDGAIVWYDFAVNNPRNPDVRRVTRAEVRALFPGCRIRARRITLAPPVARWLVPKWWMGALLLEGLRVFNTHEIALIRPR